MSCQLGFGSSRRLRVALLSSAVAVGLVAAAAAQDAETGEDDDVLIAETVTVYGTSNPIPVFEYPGQVSVISREEVERRQGSAPGDILRDVPGVDFAGGPRRTGQAPSLRGLSGENVLILIDGARQSFISAHDGRFFLDPELIGTAEVVRGLASALYGSGAVGGVLAFETVDAEDLLRDGETWGARLRGGFQSVNDEQFATVTLYTQQDKLDALGSFGLRRSGDIELGSGATLPSDDDIQTGLVKLSYNVTDAFVVEGSWQGFTNEAVEPNNGQGVILDDPVLSRDVVKDIQSDTFRLGLTFNPANELIDAGLTAYQTISSVDEFDDTIPRTTLREIETTGFNVRNASRFRVGGVETTLTVGGDYFEDEQVGRDSVTDDRLRAGVPDGVSRFTGVFAQIEAEVDRPLGLPGSLIVIPGARYDEFESSSSVDPEENSDDAVSPRFAVSYGPVDWFRVFGSYSEGFRAPSINELYLNGVHFPLPHPVLFNPMAGQFVFVNNNFIPNPELIPEVSETLEFGVGVDFRNLVSSGDRLQGKISYYESDVEDLINLSVNIAFDQTCFFPPNFPCSAGTTNSANIDAAELDGIEAELAYDSDRTFARITYASIDGINAITGEDIGSLTPDRLALDVGLKVPEFDSLFGLRIQSASDFTRRELDDTGQLVPVETRDGYVSLDAYVSWTPTFGDGLRVDLGVDNIFDEDFERVFEGVSQPGQNVKLTVSYPIGG